MTPSPSLPLLKIQNLHSPQLALTSWQILPGQCWAVLGRNGSGKHYVSELLQGKLEEVEGTLEHHFKRISVLSFEKQQAFYEQQLREDDSEFSEGPDNGLTVRELLDLQGALPPALQFLGLEPLLDRGYRLLSSGEARKALLAQALLSEPDLLILDEPFDSLDITMRAQLAEFFERLSRNTCLLFLLNTQQDLFPWHTHVAVLEKGQLIAQGERGILEAPELQALLRFDAARLPPWPEPLHAEAPADPLLRLVDGTVNYGDTRIFSGVNLQLGKGEHTLITGPNGSGKSTLLGLITGDHPQCYGNELYLFGRRRGSGETIWELKRHFGMVTPALHRDHRVPGSALDIVVSGFFDSIGLYERPEPSQWRHAQQWLALVGLEHQAETPFKHLSYGEQRLALIARALVKQPPLLLLDEPTQGLDDINRHRLLYFLEHLATQHASTIIMASHRQDEFLPLFVHHLAMENFAG
ncbi:MAG: ATP-binding cassette domain-containing protein [Pseudomonadales bacterium]|jgi:molybdate transport system ATP-binding protein|nr:ATP-binding cassette domain-containing protein [Pseudomonadales bacterium]